MNSLNNKIYENLELLPLDLQGWNGNSNVFMELIQETRPEIIVEIGTWKGQSAINMANCCKSLGLQTKIYCIDTWLGALEFWHGLNETPERDLMLKNGYPQIYYQFLSNVVHSNCQDMIIPVPLPSILGIKLLNKLGIKAGLIYIDGSHEYEDVVLDIAVSNDLISKTKAVIFGDDYRTFRGVLIAVNKIQYMANKTLEIRENNFWILRNED